MNRSLAYRCFTVLLVALLAGCGGGGGGSTGTLPTSTTVTTSSPSSAQATQMALNLNYAGTGKMQKTASAASVGLPANTLNVRVHVVNPSTGADVIAPIYVARTAGALTQLITISNVPYGNYQLTVESLGTNDVRLAYHNENVSLSSPTTTVEVTTSVTLVSLAIAPLTATIAVGATQVYVATGTFSDSSTAILNPVATWSSSATTVAGIAAGTAVGLQPGITTITAFLEGQNASASLTVTGTIPNPSPSPSPSSSPTYVGSAVCGQCHIAFPPANGYHAGDATDSTVTSSTYLDLAAVGSIYNNYVGSVHYTPNGTTATDAVRCEGCHGPGSLHYGTGPIPNRIPAVAQCGGCHDSASPGTSVAATDTVDVTAFNLTAHTNPTTTPDQFFFQGAVSATAQADYMSQPEWKDIGGTVAVTKNEHIEECSVCHSPNTKASHIANNTLPNPPQVACGSCHDAHQPSVTVRNYVTTRAVSEGAVAPHLQVNFIPVQVNNTAGTGFGANDKVSGTWIRPRNHFAYKPGGNAVNNFSGYANQATQGDWLRLSGERLCASCHTRGQYKYGRRYGSTNLSGTHNTDVYTQYLNSAHATKTDAPWDQFSLTCSPVGASHRPQYPVDMGGKAGSGQNGTTTAFDGRINGGANNFDCNQCHHGIGTIDYLNGTQGGVALGTTNAAHVLWGDQTTTCITCHDPHKSSTGATKNVRLPKYLSYNAEFKPWTNPASAVNVDNAGNALGGQNTFMDLTPIPSGLGNSQLCLFCHQGRESGWTAWNKIRRARVAAGDAAQTAIDFWYNSPNTAISASGYSFINDHYLSGGANLFGRNSTEFLNHTYCDGIPAHIAQNCTGCHMSNASTDSTQGGHTFKPVVTTCQPCHAGSSNFDQMFAQGDYNGNGTVETAYSELGAVVTIPAGTSHATPLYGTATGGTGLFGLLNQRLWDQGIEYDPDVYPYFYKSGMSHTSANAYKAWTPNTMAAAMNIQQLWKTGTTGHQAAYVHNAIYTAQILIDSLEAVGKTTGTTGTFARPTSATGGTTHTGRDYRTYHVTNQ